MKPRLILQLLVLNLISVSNTLVSFDSFIYAMSTAEKQDYGAFTGINDNYCFVGSHREKINAVIPLYINYQHMKRIRILEGIWLGHLFTLDSYGYDKNQEIGLLKLLFDIIQRQEELKTTQRSTTIIREIEKVCQFIITESEGFKSAYGADAFEKWLIDVRARIDCKFDYSVQLMIGHLSGTLEKTIQAISHEQCRRFVMRKSKEERRQILNTLMYGVEITTLILNFDKVHIDYNRDPDHIEKSFIDYFYDETKEPIKLVKEVYTGEDRKMICDTDEKYISSLLFRLPDDIKSALVALCGKSDVIVDYDLLRRELIMSLCFDVIPNHVSTSNAISIVDEKLAGNLNDMIKLDLNEDNVKMLVYIAVFSKTVEGFAGFMRKYCPGRRGLLFTFIIYRLLSGGCTLTKEKLVCLLTNKVGYTTFYQHLDEYCWKPVGFSNCEKEEDLNDDLLLVHRTTEETMKRIRQIVGNDELRKIEKANMGKKVVKSYRIRNIPNRHGFSNFNPNPYHILTFTGYNSASVGVRLL